MQTCMHTHVHTCNSRNIGISALPDMYMSMMTEGSQCLGHEYGHIRQCTISCVATNMLYFQYSKNLP